VLTRKIVGAASSDALNSHLNDKVTLPDGVHGLRVQNGKLEWQDGNEWKNIEVEVEGEDIRDYVKKLALKHAIIFG